MNFNSSLWRYYNGAHKLPFLNWKTIYLENITKLFLIEDQPEKAGEEEKELAENIYRSEFVPLVKIIITGKISYLDVY